MQGAFKRDLRTLALHFKESNALNLVRTEKDIYIIYCMVGKILCT